MWLWLVCLYECLLVHGYTCVGVYMHMCAYVPEADIGSLPYVKAGSLG